MASSSTTTSSSSGWSISTYLLIIQTVLIGLVVAYVYFYGIPPEMKRWIEKEALETLGENKASYAMKAAMDQVPDADQENVRDIKKDLKKVGGSGLQNPLGKFVGEKGDDATKDFTGR